jgi:hypothetical protein
MKKLHAASNLPEAHLLAGLLEQHGIAVRIFNANASSLAGVAGEIPVDQARPQVWVEDPARFDEARRLVDEYLARNPWAPPRRCAKCGEENPASFELCWSCGASLA